MGCFAIALLLTGAILAGCAGGSEPGGSSATHGGAAVTTSSVARPSPASGNPSPHSRFSALISPPRAVLRSSSGLPLLPDPRLTPGAALPVPVGDLCTSGYAQSVRDVPEEVKERVYAEYGIRAHRPGAFEVDHLVSLELGGSNSIKNLWPQSYLTHPWNARVKDALEDRLHEMVCSGQIDLKAAQHDIAANWIAAYQKYFGTATPLPVHSRVPYRGSLSNSRRTAAGGARRRARTTAYSSAGEGSAAAAAAAGAAPNVWVNLRSGRYFLPGSRYYGATRQGEYMTESKAHSQGYVRARA